MHVEGARDAAAAAVEDMGVNHRRAHVAVPEKLLNRADVVAILEQVGREGVTKAMTRGRLGNPRFPHGLLYGALEDGFVKVMTADLACAAVDIEACRRKGPLPCPLMASAGVLPFDRVG